MAPDRQAAKRIVFRILAVVILSYVSLLLIEMGLIVVRPEAVSPLLLMRGLFVPDAEQGHRLNPGHAFVWDDRIVRGARVTINSLGHRDGEPEGDGTARVLLLGDSYTFGSLLDDSEKIDRAIERASGGRLDAYNLGVPAYGAAEARISFERFGLPAAHAVYLFYHNDLRNDALDPTATTVYRGFLVSRLDADGRPFDETELDRRIESILRPPSWIPKTFRLSRIRSISSPRIARGEPLPGPGPLRDLEVGEDDHPLGYRFENVDSVVSEVEKMQIIARERQTRFAVLIIPGVAEAEKNEHFAIVAKLVDRLRAKQVEIIDPIGALDQSAYHTHDLHFNARGAEITAESILDWLSGPAG